MNGDPRLDDWLDALLATPGLTAIADRARAWQEHVADALSAVPLLGTGPVVDVGSGGGSPGLPLASVRPDLHVDLLDASRRRCAFLEGAARPFPNVAVVRARAEDYGREAGRDAYGTAVSRALAPPPVATEWCLPLVRPGGLFVLFTGDPGPGLGGVARALGAEPPEEVAVPGSERRRLLVFHKVDVTPDRFPRRPGIARKRPLA